MATSISTPIRRLGVATLTAALASMTLSRPDPAIYQDSNFMRELLRRDEIQGGANTLELRQLMRGR